MNDRGHSLIVAVNDDLVELLVCPVAPIFNAEIVEVSALEHVPDLVEDAVVSDAAVGLEMLNLEIVHQLRNEREEDGYSPAERRVSANCYCEMGLARAGVADTV